MTYAQLLNAHIYPYIGKRRVAEIGRETIHPLLTVVLPEQGASQGTVVNDLLAHAARTGAKQESLRLTHQEPHPHSPKQFKYFWEVLLVCCRSEGGATWSAQAMAPPAASRR